MNIKPNCFSLHIGATSSAIGTVSYCQLVHFVQNKHAVLLTVVQVLSV